MSTNIEPVRASTRATTGRTANTLGGQASYILLLLAAFGSTWTGVAVVGVKPADIALALATLVGIPALLQTPLPRWVLIGSGALVLLAFIHLWLPTSSAYLMDRFTLPRLPGAGPPSSAFKVGIQWLVALAVLPWLTRAQCGARPQKVERILVAWLLGTLVSVLVAVSDFLGFTHVAFSLTHGALTTGRQSGLSAHVNHFGFACAMAIPIAIFIISSGRPVGGLTALGLLLMGSVLSGSRGSQIGVVTAFILSAVFTRQGRRLAIPIMWLCVLVSTMVLAVRPQLFSAFGDLIRFGDRTAYVSDEARAMAAEQAIQDFRTHPVAGVGLEVLTEAHNIILQALAAGGVILLLGLAVYFLDAIKDGIRAYRKGYVAAGFSVASACTLLVMGTFQNQISDRYLYVPIAAICALSSARPNTLSEKRNSSWSRS